MNETSPVSSLEQHSLHVVSVYDGFFSGGARVLHTDMIRNLDATTDQTHSVLSLHNAVERENSVQLIEQDARYKRLAAAGIAIRALNRQSAEGISTPMSDQDRVLTRYVLEQADVIVSLKEQPLSIISQFEYGNKPLFACLHRSDPENQGESLETLVKLHELGKLTAAICCARSTQLAYHEATGIPLAALPVVPNGVNLYTFKPSRQQRTATRRELAIPETAPTILLAARYDAMKNVPLFIRSVAQFAKNRPEAHILMCGAGMTTDNTDLTRRLERKLRRWDNAPTNVHLLGIQTNMPALYNACDIVSLTSAFGEAAPLTLLEGMACGAIPVTTDVGDAASMVRNPDLVTTSDSRQIAQTWEMALASKDFLQRQIASFRGKLSSELAIDKYYQILSGKSILQPLSEPATAEAGA